MRQFLGAFAKGISFKRAHRAVPHYRGNLGQQFFVLCNRVAANVQNHLVGGHVAHGAGGSRLTGGQFLGGHNIHGQGQFSVKILGLLHDALGVRYQIFLVQRLADHVPGSRKEGIGNAAAHDKHVHFFQQIFQQGQLGGHLGAADDGSKRAGGIVQHLGKGIQLRLKQRPGAGNLGNAHRTLGGGMRAVGRPKGVHHIYIAQGGKLRGQSGVVLFLALEKTHILKQGHRTGSRLGFFQRGGEGNRFAQQLGKAGGHGLEGELLFILPFCGAAQMRKQHHARAFFKGRGNGGQRSADALVVGYLSVLHGHVQVFANHNGFAGQVQILHFLDGHMRSPCKRICFVLSASYFPSCRKRPSATSSTCATVKPRRSKTILAGAEAPKRSIPTTAPSRPTYLRQ